MNDDDSEQVSALLQGMGYTPCERQEDADIAVLVTCSVREKPEQKAKSKLGELRVLKEEKPGLLIGLCGCMAQRVGESVRKTRPFIEFVVGTGQIHTIPEIIRQIDEERRPVSSLYLPQGQQDGIAPRAGRETRALKRFVPVMYGCDNFCSYCVVPYARGRERSRPVMDIIDEISQLAGNGCKDVTLLGQNVNSYGQTLEDKPDFADLLGRVNDIPGIERIRFTTSHPKDLSDRLIEAMRDLPKVCEHIHLAVQSGDDEVLARGRGGDVQDDAPPFQPELGETAVVGVEARSDHLDILAAAIFQHGIKGMLEPADQGFLEVPARLIFLHADIEGEPLRKQHLR